MTGEANIVGGSVRGLGAFPVQFDVPVLPDRRSRAAMRFMARWAAVALLAMGSLGGIAMAVAPLKSGAPMIGINGRDGIYGAKPTPQFVSGDAAYVQALTEEYVGLRLSILKDRAAMNAIWGQGGKLSAYDMDFDALIAGASAGIVSDMNGGVTQSVENLVSREISPGRAYAVDFDLVRRDASGAVIQRVALTAHVETSFDPTKGSTLLNPLGFQVVAYSQEPRK